MEMYHHPWCFVATRLEGSPGPDWVASGKQPRSQWERMVIPLLCQCNPQLPSLPAPLGRGYQDSQSMLKKKKNIF